VTHSYGIEIGAMVDRLRGKTARYSGVNDAFWRPKPRNRIIATLTADRTFTRLLELTDIDFTYSAIEGVSGSVYFPVNAENLAKLNELLDAQDVVHAARTGRV